jgi:ubiquinone/menaquinone biosynthesis C-methylase UbiE
MSAAITEYKLMPPVELILGNKIGHVVNSDVMDLFDKIGHGFIDEMKREGIINRDSRVLDVGCGLGRLARPLVEYLSLEGCYCGIDVCKSSIDWCRENYAAYSNFKFLHANVFSTTYNPGSKTRAADYRFPFDDSTFDSIFSTSLFTHLVPKDAGRYIEEIGRVLSPGGKTYNTFLLLDEISDPLASTFGPARAHLYLSIPIEDGRIAVETDPEALTGINLNFIKAAHERSGLQILEIRNGPWSGRTDSVKASYQDVIIAKHA